MCGGGGGARLKEGGEERLVLRGKGWEERISINEEREVSTEGRKRLVQMGEGY